MLNYIYYAYIMKACIHGRDLFHSITLCNKYIIAVKISHSNK